MSGKRLVEIVDFGKDSVAIGIERTEVVFAIRVVGWQKSSYTAMVLTIRATASGPRAAMPAVITAWPLGRLRRSSSLSARIRSVVGFMVCLDQGICVGGERCSGRRTRPEL